MVDVIVKPPKIETPHIDAIHGHTRIELKDVHTGKRERVESDNVVTDGIQYYLDTYDFWNKSSYITNIYRVNKKFDNAILDLFGGIFLFDKQIPETAQYMPAGTKMIGNGSYKVSNSSTVTELGSYNSTESVETSNSFIQVYDYTTAQANGEINSVCLATATGGFIGYGNSAAKSYKDYLIAPNSSSKSDDYYSFRVSGYSNSNTVDLATAVSSASVSTPSSSTNELKNISSITKNSIYNCLMSMQSIKGATLYLPDKNCILVGYVQPSTKEVFILKKDYPKSKVLDLKLTKGFYNIDIYKQITIDELDSNKNYSCMLKPDGTKAIIFSWPSSGWEVNTTLNFIIYDIDNNTYTSHDVENNTSVNWSSSFSNIPIFPLANGNLIINWISKDNTSSGAVNIIDFVSNTAIKKLQMSDIPYARGYNNNLLELQENLFYSPEGTMYDLVNKTAYPMNGYFPDSNYIACCTPYVMEYYRNSSRGFGEIRLFPVCNPLRLMTINNLPSTITKTAAQTMKVTYTLTME